ncbi:hypothetical protein [Clostridium sp. C8-1-8]|uniref:hypothetical protein n=1 Tax=Clostridium sp. C8-1-8 TaxID=2698831 RepID=UPI00136A1C0A|nr:hypothetical protein [Clostridium sp. C8-1-8]
MNKRKYIIAIVLLICSLAFLYNGIKGAYGTKLHWVSYLGFIAFGLLSLKYFLEACKNHNVIRLISMEI